jgi:hypothetical protein
MHLLRSLSPCCLHCNGLLAASIIITFVTSGVIERKQQINPGAHKAPPRIWQGFSSLPAHGPDEAGCYDHKILHTAREMQHVGQLVERPKRSPAEPHISGGEVQTASKPCAVVI